MRTGESSSPVRDVRPTVRMQIACERRPANSSRRGLKEKITMSSVELMTRRGDAVCHPTSKKKLHSAAVRHSIEYPQKPKGQVSPRLAESPGRFPRRPGTERA